MNTSLNEALAQLNLQPGETYQTTVNGCKIEVRALKTADAAAPIEESSDYADQTMLEPWFTIPFSTGGLIVEARFGPLPLPDQPIVLPEEEEIG